MLELICRYFIDGGFVFSTPYLRVGKLRRQLPFYESYLRDKSSKSLSQRLASDISLWKRKAETTHDYLYVGRSFGEINYQGLIDGECSYVDIRQKIMPSYQHFSWQNIRRKTIISGLLCLDSFVFCLRRVTSIQSSTTCSYTGRPTRKALG